MKLLNMFFNWLTSLFTNEKSESEKISNNVQCDENTDDINALIDECMVKANSYHKFIFPKGRVCKVYVGLKTMSPSGTTTAPTSGTVITLQHNKRKVAIGARRWYASRQDAEKVAEVWNKLIDASNTKWDIYALAIPG